MQEPATAQQTAYVYVLVRTDLPAPIRTVQSSHAAIAATFAFGEPENTHPHLVICAIANERDLLTAFNKLKEKGVPCCAWHEDDMDNELTAVATAPLRGSERKPMSNYPLLK